MDKKRQWEYFLFKTDVSTSGEELLIKLNNLGKEGWELVSTIPLPHTSTYADLSNIRTAEVRYHFKRRIPTDTSAIKAE